MYARDPANTMWLKFTRLQQWLTEVNEYVIGLYRKDKADKENAKYGETYFAMKAGKPILAQYD